MPFASATTIEYAIGLGARLSGQVQQRCQSISDDPVGRFGCDWSLKPEFDAHILAKAAITGQKCLSGSLIISLFFLLHLRFSGFTAKHSHSTFLYVAEAVHLPDPSPQLSSARPSRELHIFHTHPTSLISYREQVDPKTPCQEDSLQTQTSTM